MHKQLGILAAIATSLILISEAGFAAESQSGGKTNTPKSVATANSKLHMLEFYLPGAGCGGCRLRLERLLRQMNGAKRARVTGSRAKAVIYYDSSVTKSAAFLELMKKEGYETEEIHDQAVASLPEEEALPRGVELKGLDDLKPVF
jgi:copper chaperone CopZ